MNPELNPPPPNGTQPTVVVPEPITDSLNRLLGTMTSPEEGLNYGVEARPTPGTIKNSVKDLVVHTGPADVPAFYDFHSLEIAFDYVWQKAIDENIIELVTMLTQQVQDMGGAPVSALSNGTDPIKALREELQIVGTALTKSSISPNFSAGQWSGTMRANGNGSSNGIHGPASLRGSNSVVSGEDITEKTEYDTTTLPNELLNQIETLLSQRFAFDIFAPGSVNFGILVTYRQRWVPQTYQVGNLVKTLTLTPKETRKVTAKRVVKKDRSVKEMENSLRIRKEESNDTARDEAEIIAKAEAKTNFSLTAQGTYNIGIYKGDATTVFGKDAATNSSDTKKAFREAVIKASQEYKDEHKLELETKESFEEEVTESVEITNPNDELAVTYLFYELQRRYKISEHIHRLCPVVLVAMDVPSPSQKSIDALLLTHGWIIDRVLLDDQFRQPLEYFRLKLVGEEFAQGTMAANLTIMQGVVAQLQQSYSQARTVSNQLADLLSAAIVTKAKSIAEDKEEGWLEKVVELGTGEQNGDEAINVDAARVYEDLARERYERAVNQEKALRSQLDSETAALKTASDDYAKAKAEHLNHLMDVGVLRLHIKENILYYMQAIWSHTFKDQIFLALHKIKVPRLSSEEVSYSLSPSDEPPPGVTAQPGQTIVELKAKAQFESGLNPDDFAPLVEVADLDNLLGFKGNYLIFPLKQSNILTDFMMTPFVDSELGLRDPDEFGNFTPEEFITYAHALHKDMKQQLQNGEITEEDLQATIDQLENQFRHLLSAPHRAEDEIIVPTTSLYIEAMPAAHPILEDFKLIHRSIDVKKVQAEVRKLEMENIRYAARILEGEREDPDIDKKIIVEGKEQNIIIPTDG